MQTPPLDIEFKYASPKEWTIIQATAYKTWPTAYGEMISIHQLNHMLDLIYSESSIERQMEVMKHEFIIGSQTKRQFGFTSIQQHYRKDNQLMIHKLYVLPEFHGKGFGKAFIEYITKLAMDAGHDTLCLRVYDSFARII